MEQKLLLRATKARVSQENCVILDLLADPSRVYRLTWLVKDLLILEQTEKCMFGDICRSRSVKFALMLRKEAS